MTQTQNLNLLYLMPAQSLKHITFNEAMFQLDNLVQLAVKSQTSTPPSDAVAGDTYLVAVNAIGIGRGSTLSSPGMKGPENGRY
ncbi:MAG: DUF2793 domain-containing protein [Litorimonas sp.]